MPVKKILVIASFLLVALALFWAFQKKLPVPEVGSTTPVHSDELEVLEPYQTPTPESPIPYSLIIEEKEAAW